MFRKPSPTFQKQKDCSITTRRLKSRRVLRNSWSGSRRDRTPAVRAADQLKRLKAFLMVGLQRRIQPAEFYRGYCNRVTFGYNASVPGRRIWSPLKSKQGRRQPAGHDDVTTTRWKSLFSCQFLTKNRI